MNRAVADVGPTTPQRDTPPLPGWCDVRRIGPARWMIIVIAALLGFGVAPAPIGGPAFAVLGGGCALLIMIDLAVHRLPDRIIWPMTAAIVVLLGIQAALDADPGRWGRALAAATVAGILLLIMAVISPSGLGLGDVKLAVPLGFALGWFGWAELAGGLVSAFVINGVVLGALMLAGRVRRGDDIAFGPSLVAGALIGGAVVAALS